MSITARSTAGVVAGLALLLAAATAPASTLASTAHPAVASGGVWTTYGANNARTAVQSTSPSLADLHQAWISPQLDGAVYGEPLIDGNRIYVATEADVVYGLSAKTGAVIWSRVLGAPVPANLLPCGDINPTVGVTSTMVLDPSTGLLFASAAVDSGGAVTHKLFGLSASSGRIRSRRDLDQPGWIAAAQLQRTGLGLDGDRVIVSFGGNWGDCAQYHGYVMSAPETNGGATRVYQVPTQREGAIWAPAGIAIDSSGDIFAATGNGSSNSAFDYGDAVIKLSPTLQVLGYFAPANWVADNRDDGDLGSTSPVLVAGGKVFIVGKEQTGYLFSAENPGGIGGAVASTNVCTAFGGDAYRSRVVYVGCPGSGVTAVRVGASSLSVIWRASPSVGGSPTIAGGLLWSIGSGELNGLAASSGAVVVRVPVISTEHFAAPSAGDGLLVVGGANNVQAFEGAAGYRP